MFTCPFCGNRRVTFSKKRGTHICNRCKNLNATPEEYAQWQNAELPLNEKELTQVARAFSPRRIVVQRLLATLEVAQQVDPGTLNIPCPDCEPARNSCKTRPFVPPDGCRNRLWTCRCGQIWFEISTHEYLWTTITSAQAKAYRKSLLKKHMAV